MHKNIPVKVIRNSILPLSGFSCINLFGVVFARRGCVVDAEVLRHEAIHTRQMQEMGYIFFYLWYLAEWLIRITSRLARVVFIPKGSRRQWLRGAYESILFEREAYRFASQTDYLQNRRHYAWIREFITTK